MSGDLALYDAIGDGYNNTRQADPYLAGRLAVLSNFDAEGSYLDIGCGSGNYTVYLASKGIKFTGIEPSFQMLKEAKAKSTTVDWLNGSAELMPLKERMFDGAIATLTIHHWQSLEASFNELNRVIKPGGSIVLFTALPDQMELYWLNHYFPVMMLDAIKQMPSLEMIGAAANSAGIAIRSTERYAIKPDLQDLFLYSGKHNPELYFDERVRKGISSFAALSNRGELEKGLRQLEDDMNASRFEQVKERFDNNGGDYLFIVLQKTD